MVDHFSTQRHPTVEQTLSNNSQSLYKQKKLFLADLRTLAGTLGYALIGVLYLRDVSTIVFILRAICQFFLFNPFAANINHVVIPEETRNEQRWFLLWSVLLVNGFSLFDHVVFGAYSSSKVSDHQLHGGLSIQFIGDRLPFSRWELVVYDTAIFAVQLFFYCLMCTTDDSEVLHTSAAELAYADETVQADILSDGFNGNVNLLTIDLFACVKRSWSYHRRSETEQRGSPVAELSRQRAFRRMFV